jgi:hypothetical protein
LKCYSYSTLNDSSISVELYPCPDGFICDVNITDPQIAWANATSIFYSNVTTTDETVGPNYKKRTLAYCVSMEKYKQNLLAGR